MLSLVATVLLAGVPAPPLACLWDSDTLAAEAKGLPDVVHVIVGRFERNPALYYQMRLDRVAGRLASHPDDFAAYDDAGVACDRLGRGDEAIAWMEKKREAIERVEASGGKPLNEERYRYLANVGTFRVHRWFKAGADRSKIDEVEAARDSIARAIALNPDAHFGREKYQLMVMDWIVHPPEGRHSLTTFLDPQDPAFKPNEAVRGLSGLIALGNAWESVDVFHALALAIREDGERNVLAMLAELRASELIDAGRRSLGTDAPTDPAALKRAVAVTEFVKDPGRVRRAFAQLRAEADAWQKGRTDYLMAGLKGGRHPDTDADFWKGYREPSPPEIPDVLAVGTRTWYRRWRMRRLEGIVAVGLIVGGLVWWKSRKSRAKVKGNPLEIFG